MEQVGKARGTRGWLVVAAAMLAFGVGCGGASKASDSAYTAQGAPAAAPAAESASSPGGDARGEVAAASPAARQGLGTTWGERRESWVENTEFVRDDPARPLRAFAIRYNDRAGIEAQIGSGMAWSSSLDAAEVSVELRGESGPLSMARSGDRHYVVGVAGDRYTIRVHNRTGRRIEVVASVDGLDVINGKEASVRRRGYVVNGYESVDIDGFRQSQGSVAAFRFGSVGDSYAAAKSDARNVGVIGVAVFGEQRYDQPTAEELRMRERATPFPGSDPRYAAPPR